MRCVCIEGENEERGLKLEALTVPATRVEPFELRYNLRYDITSRQSFLSIDFVRRYGGHTL